MTESLNMIRSSFTLAALSHPASTASDNAASVNEERIIMKSLWFLLLVLLNIPNNKAWCNLVCEAM